MTGLADGTAVVLAGRAVEGAGLGQVRQAPRAIRFGRIEGMALTWLNPTHPRLLTQSHVYAATQRQTTRDRIAREQPAPTAQRLR